MNSRDITINKSLAESTSNFYFLSDKDIKDGIIKSSTFQSNVVNSLLHRIYLALDVAQKNGIQQFNKYKEYDLNSIVSALYLDPEGSLTITFLKCINLNNDTFCNVIPNDNHIELENGTILYNNNSWNELYWQEVTINKNLITKTQIKDFVYDYKDIEDNPYDNKQVKLYKLLDLSKEESFIDGDIVFKINRNNEDILFEVNVNGNKDNIYARITVSNDFNLIEDDIFYKKSVFKNIARNGLLLCTDKNSLYLVVIGLKSVEKEYIDIQTISYNYFNIFAPYEVEESNFMNNEDYTLIPINTSSSNIFDNNQLQVKDNIALLNPKQKFQSGLYHIEKEIKENTWLYPALRYCNNKKDGMIYDTVNKAKYGSNTVAGGLDRYKNKTLPRLYGNTGETLDKVNYSGRSWSGPVCDKSYLSGCFKKGKKVPNDEGAAVIFAWYDNRVSIDPPQTIRSKANSLNYYVDFSLYDPLFKKGENDINIRRINVYTYIKLW